MDDAAHSKTWRVWFVALCTLSLVLCLAETVCEATVAGSPDIGFAPTRAAFVYRVTVPPPHSSLHAGDLVDLRALSGADRWGWNDPNFRRGESYVLAVTRNGHPVHVSFVAAPARYFGAPLTSLASWPYWLAMLGTGWMIAFAMIIAWRRAGSREARLLALLLLLIPLGALVYNWYWGPPALTASLYAAGNACSAVGSALVVTYAMLFTPASRSRRFLAWSLYAPFALAAVWQCVWVFAVWTLAIDPNGVLFSQKVVGLIDLLPCLVALVCGALAIAKTKGSERARLSWTMASLGAFYLLSLIGELVRAVAPEHMAITYMLDNTGVFIAPLGLTYALLNRKLLDVGFALNRAAIFTAVSAVVVGVFVLVEWTFGEWLRDASHATNVAASGGLALVLGYSVRFVHGRVEHVVDNVFFRKRHEDEAALRAFAHEAGYINNTGTLTTRTIAVIERHAEASSVQLAVDGGHGRYGHVNEDDPAIVALRAWNKVVDLHTVQTALHGELAFPMIARGRLVGALVLGPKRSGETYAPDESDAIMQIAQSVGTSLAVLEHKPTVAGEDLEEVRAFRQDTRDGIRALQDRMTAIVQRLDAR